MKIDRRNLLMLGIAAALPGCMRRSSSAGASKGAVLRYPIPIDPTTFDPQICDSADTNEMLGNVYEGLITLDEQTHCAPCLAESWDLSGDGKTFTFHLNPKATFHNGQPVTADDVKYSLERALLPDTRSPFAPDQCKQIVGALDMTHGKRRDLPGVRVIDTLTVSITTVTPTPYLLIDVGSLPIVCRSATEANGSKIDAKSSVGTGPFRFVDYVPGQKVVMEAHKKHYFGPPPLDRIERSIVLDPETRRHLYEAGDIDYTALDLPTYIQYLNSPERKPELKSCAMAEFAALGLNSKVQPAYRDLRVRRALAQAIDVDAIIRVVFHGLAARAEGFLAPGVLGHDSSTHRLPFDPAAARQLLAAAGYPGGRGFPTLTLDLVQKTPVSESIAELVRNHLRTNLDISVNLNELEAGTLFAEESRQSLPMALSGWTNFDPFDIVSTLFRTGSPQNHFAYSNPAVDALLAKADVEMDVTRRGKLYAQADQMLTDDVASIPIAYERSFYVVKPRVKGLQFNLGGVMPHYHTSITG